MIYDVAVIGAGVTGSFIARELSKYELDICVLEKEEDVGLGASSANSGIVHAGFDAEPGSLKARLNVCGNEMMEQIAKELEVPFIRNGSLVIAFSEEDMDKIKELYQRGLANGVEDMQIVDSLRLREVEPNITENAVGALYASTAGIICPYELTLSAMENAVANGAVLMCGCEVRGITKENAGFRIFTTRGEIEARHIVNAAGVYSDSVSSMVGETDFSITPRKGEYLLMDKTQGKTVNSVIFQVPSKMGKGILVSPTVDGNLLIGPSATDIEDRSDDSTSRGGLNQVIQGALKSVPSINTREVITSFAGIRATPSTGDFIIEEHSRVKGFINVAGIESPGLTSAPAIAVMVTGILGKCGLKLEVKSSFNPHRSHIKRFSELNESEKMQAIKANPGYGHVVCRCEKVTEGEIIDAIRRPTGARSLDGVKRRTRAGMGRCQGGFCTPRIAELLSRELGIPMEEVTKMGGNSRILIGRTK